VRAHEEATRNCVVTQRASVGAVETLRADEGPPKANAEQARVTLGRH